MGPLIQLGAFVVDAVTGFSGYVTARAEYITGCAQVLVQPKVKEDGTFVEPRWIDETRLRTDKCIEPLDVNGSDNGADISAPVK
jgi:hypothetical protein